MTGRSRSCPTRRQRTSSALPSRTKRTIQKGFPKKRISRLGPARLAGVQNVAMGGEGQAGFERGVEPGVQGSRGGDPAEAAMREVQMVLGRPADGKRERSSLRRRTVRATSCLRCFFHLMIRMKFVAANGGGGGVWKWGRARVVGAKRCLPGKGSDAGGANVSGQPGKTKKGAKHVASPDGVRLLTSWISMFCAYAMDFDVFQGDSRR
jgi:hypothetical protein